MPRTGRTAINMTSRIPVLMRLPSQLGSQMGKAQSSRVNKILVSCSKCSERNESGAEVGNEGWGEYLHHHTHKDLRRSILTEQSSNSSAWHARLLLSWPNLFSAPLPSPPPSLLPSTLRSISYLSLNPKPFVPGTKAGTKCLGSECADA